MKQSIISSAFALLVVTSMFAMPMNQIGVVGTASASHDCDTVDAAVAAITFTYVNKDKCLNNHVSHAVEEVRDIESNQTMVDLYSAGMSQKAQSESFHATYDNYLQDTETTAWSKAEVAVMQAYQNNSTKAEAKVAARDEIQQYYATKQVNLIEEYNSSIAAIEYLDNRAQQEGLVSEGKTIGPAYIVKNDTYTPKYSDVSTWDKPDNVQSMDDLSFSYYVESSATMVNGSTVNYKTVQIGQDTVSITHNETHEIMDTNDESGYVLYDPDGDSRLVYYGLGLTAPNSNYEDESVMNFAHYMKKWEEINSMNEELQNESDVFVETIWQDLQDGNIDSSDAISRNTLMFEYGTATSSGNGTYYDAIGAAAGMGLDTPDLDGTGQMQITIPDSGNTYNGMVFARNAPDNTWETGVTYTPNEITGPVMIATVDGELFEVKRDFTIDEMVDQEGNTQTTAETTNYNYQTANTSDLNAKYDELLNLTQELQNRSEAVGTGGGEPTDNDPAIPDWLSEKYGGIPLYGIIAIGLALAYVFASVRGN